MTTRTKPHILFVSSWLPTASSSAGTFVEMHALALQQRGCTCSMLLSGEATAGNYLRAAMRRAPFLPYRRHPELRYIDNLTLHLLPLSWLREPLLRRRHNIEQHSHRVLSAYFERYGRPDFIFHHGVFDYCYLSSYLSAAFDIPVWHMENAPNITASAIPCANPFDTAESQKQFLQQAQRRFAVTEAYVRHMERIFELSFERCPNVVSDDFFAKSPGQGRSADTLHFVNVAILTARKNQQLLIRAFAKCFAGRPAYRLTIAGDGPLLQELQGLAQSLKVSEQVEIRGFQRRAQIVELLDSAHCFVLPSHAETFGVVLVEALARGVPLIASRIDGPAEIVSEQCGLLFEPDSLEGLAAALRQMAAEHRRYIPQELQRYARTHFGPDAVKTILFPDE